MSNLINLANKYHIKADKNGLRLTPIADQIDRIEFTQAHQQFLASIPSLLADGIFAEVGSDGELFATFESLVQLEDREVDPVAFILSWSPLVLRIEGMNSIGYDDFKFIPRFYLGKRVVQVQTIGVIAWRNKNILRLPAAQAIALRLIGQFNEVSHGEKTKAKALDYLYRLKNLASPSSNIQFDPYLQSEVVLKPTTASLKADDDGHRAIVYPVLDGVSEEVFKRQFLNISDVQDVYDLDTGSQRQRVVIPSDLKEVFRNVKKNGFGISGRAREEFYRNPRSILPEGENQTPELIEVVGFGPRVRGLGYAAFARPINVSTKEKWFGEEQAEAPPEPNENTPQNIAIECVFIDGQEKIIEFQDLTKAHDFLARVNANLALGVQSVDLDGTNIPISQAFASSLTEQIKNKSKETEALKEPVNRQRLLIHTNEETIDYAEATSQITTSFSFALPQNLKRSVRLKEHQKIGVRWLGGLLNRDLAKGALLADDMGLGKTLQILTFLAWCIETELDELKKDLGPYDPIVIVAPLILLENWEREASQYFEAGIFSPIEKLHGSTIKKYRKPGLEGRESAPGIDTLDIEKLRMNRLIITNYETIKNYQYTFAKMPCSILVADEAQEIKDPSTAVTYALKVLNPIFRIACTGTPVETSLTNLWSIMDFAQPGNKLGSLSNFKKELANFSYDDPSLGLKLREALGFNIDSGLVMRRSKKDVLKDLPPKTILEHDCPLDPNLRMQYETIIKHVKTSQKANIAALQGLHQIAQISQHPFLIEGEPFRPDYNEYINSSSKLQTLLRILREIRTKSEKALIFTRSRKMQDILKAVLDGEFNLDVSIVNGVTASRHKYVANTRSGIIDKFSNTTGFNLLILSPEVAGVGLTITAANHVIHYGRWWNPAKENQATDRAYRIGQLNPVYVHHLILKDPTGQLETFDEKLHRLLKAREDLADNFLAPSGDEVAIENNLLSTLFEKNFRPQPEGPIVGQVDLKRTTPYEFECLVGLALKNRFDKIYVTPKSGDRGIDIVGISKNEILLIQCKKSAPNLLCQADALDELTDGADFYREKVIPRSLKNLPLKCMLVTTGKVDRNLSKIAGSKSIELLDGASFEKLFESITLTWTELRAFDSTRSRNIDELTAELASHWHDRVP